MSGFGFHTPRQPSRKFITLCVTYLLEAGVVMSFINFYVLQLEIMYLSN